MNISARPSNLEEITKLREMYRQEMNCQIIHDSIHLRSGWTREFLLVLDSNPIGYGSVAVKGPWAEAASIYEFYVAPRHRSRLFECFQAVRQVCGAKRVETQSNDPMLTNMLLAFCKDVRSEAILFHDKITTSMSIPGVHFRAKDEGDAEQIAKSELDENAQWVLERDGVVVAAGDILYHYNRPYGDVYMKVAEGHRRQGLGCLLVQELKRVCYAAGNVPAARCNIDNEPSRATLQRAGFVPCGHIIYGDID